MGINMAMVIFSNGTPAFLQYLGMQEAPAVFHAPGLCWAKVGVAFAVSVSMNTIFAPVFMTLHKITDTHILMHGGTLRGFFTPLDMGGIMSSLNWKVLWGFVFKKTIPFFWFPAHTFSVARQYAGIVCCLVGSGIGNPFSGSSPQRGHFRTG